MNSFTDNQKELQQLLAENRERLKELACINQTTQILKEGKPLDDSLQQICMLLPQAWQYPEHTVARISFGGLEFVTSGFRDTPWKQYANFESIEGKKGSIEVFYTREFQDIDEGPFLKEERHLIDNLASIISGYINSLKAKSVITKEDTILFSGMAKTQDKEAGFNSRQLLQRFLNRQNYNRDIFHDLMPFKVREILLVANLYDAYSIEKEGRFAEHILGEYYHLNLTSMPRITGVSSEEDVFGELESKHFDLVIFMVGVDKEIPLMLSRKVKARYPYIPVYGLLNNNSDIQVIQNQVIENSIDNLFVWNGDSKIFFAMVKHLEDKVNVDNDTSIGLVRVILLVEDSAKYYSRYLPLLYSNVLEQTKRIIEDVSTDELYKVLRLRARPKILLASDYKEAIDIFHKYKEFMLCLISDVKFEKDGQLDDEAGFTLVSEVRKKIRDLPIIIQSSDVGNSQRAYDLKATFINKNSDSLLQDIQSFISYFLGFGNFVYKNARGRQIAVAKSLREFEKNLMTIPDDSLIYHAKRNHFSLWLMARGEIQIAKIINPYKIQDFKSPEEIRTFLLSAIKKHRNEQNKGKVINFEESELMDETNIVALSSGSLGGKGRGLSFINTLIYNFDFKTVLPNINIRAPRTAIIGTDEFDFFLDRNHLRQKILHEENYTKIREMFLAGSLSEGLVKKLKRVLRVIKKPMAIRSSGLFEDSLMQPFAGIFETYILPNSHPDLNVRLRQAMDAIKLVFASVYSDTARGYIKAINYKIEEERMAVILQELVGTQYENYYYPHLSGVAQSYNYYPVAHMKPEEGFAVAAVGLGTYVVEGEKAYRFSPKYPKLEINSPKDQYKNSQLHYFAVDLNRQTIDLLQGEDAGLTDLEISVAEKHGVLRHTASTFDSEYERIVPGISQAGPRIINFANILKYGYIPLADTLQAVLDIVKEAMGSPVEIEFAVDLNKDQDGRASFYLLQIKPLIGAKQDYTIDLKKINRDDIILFAEKSMGNGKMEDIQDVIYADPSKFDKSLTLEMAAEIDALNKLMDEEDRKYILVGPGRWGTRDRWIGIPVNWPQISQAKVIVETSLEDFPLDASSGSHFFHNVTSMNVGYFSINQESGNAFIDWEKLNKMEAVRETKFFRHVRFPSCLKVKMDGKKRIGLILWDQECE